MGSCLELGGDSVAYRRHHGVGIVEAGFAFAFGIMLFHALAGLIFLLSAFVWYWTETFKPIFRRVVRGTVVIVIAAMVVAGIVIFLAQ